MAQDETEPRAERRLAAILASDVAGYSRLMGLDEEGTLRALKGHRKALVDPSIAAHHGRIVKTTGDGMLVEFASVIDAARCAVEIQREMIARNKDVPSEKRIEFRMGINIGDIIVDGSDIFGDGVNVAARLEGIAEPGGICLSNAVYEQVRDKLKEEFIDLGDKSLKNIARAMRVYAVKAGRERSASSAASAPQRSGPPRLSIVVLPFANIGGDPPQDYFVDGVTESLTTDLSRISGSFVIGSHTAFSYKGEAIDLKQIGRELNVRYILEGSVQRGDNRIRVNAQLIDAESGNHLWAERYDKPVADLFDMQDEIVTRLARQLDAALITAEARRAERSPHPDSMDFYFQGMVWINKGLNPNDLAQAQTYFERALAIDSDNLDALVWNAWADVQLAVTGSAAHERAARLAAAEAAAAKALLLAPNHAWAHMAMGVVFGFTNRIERAIAECERALALDRNFARAHAIIGLHKLHLDRGEETEAHVLEALRLSPRDTLVFAWLAAAGFAKDYLGRYEEAVAWQRRSIEANGNHPTSHFHLAIALAHLARLDEARAAARVGLSLDPHFTIASFLAGTKFSDSPAHLAWRERQANDLRKAGVPEG
jgi:TolB-like protein